jgi:hypothetical protein
MHGGTWLRNFGTWSHAQTVLRLIEIHTNIMSMVATTIVMRGINMVNWDSITVETNPPLFYFRVARVYGGGVEKVIGIFANQGDAVQIARNEKLRIDSFVQITLSGWQIDKI